MQAGISRNQLPTVIRTNGCIIKVDETQRFGVFRLLGQAERNGG